MTAEPAAVPFEETLVKKPGNCPVLIEGEVNPESGVRAVVGVVCTFQTLTLLPPLETTRPMPSDPLKYDGPHQHPPMPYSPSTLLEFSPPRSPRLSRYMIPTLPAAAATRGPADCLGSSITPPDPKSASSRSSVDTSTPESVGLKYETTRFEIVDQATTLSERLTVFFLL